MSRLVASRLRLFFILVILSTLLGVLDGYLGNLEKIDEQATAMFHGGINWLVGSSLVWGFEILAVQSRYGVRIRRLHFLTAIALKSVVLVLIVIFVGLFARAIFHDLYGLEFITDPEFFRTLLFVFTAIVLMQTGLQIVRIIGGRTLINFVLGKYHRPIREEKIFMFLDLVGSTPLAERLGDVGVQSMITKFFFDITEPIIEHGGEIHRYVGDQVVVTWPIRANAANMRSILCCFAIAKRVNDLAPDYELEFGTVPAFRIGLHGGPVVISQIGDQKQEISYFGDTVNATARIEQQCKSLDSSLLISAELLERITLSPTFQAQHKGTVQLRGRGSETKLFTIVQAQNA
ncbi:MAG: adenylate/guanylate cyclase domain-containing protein [Rhodospirillaceae bacterium]|jgi:adenylate cyclase|nr:adenylate/guanylate cyclase domain-containing protein [Rhodospirillaceae bacterium]MBT7487866.1 adenylate/guanylate cyclase domain-containing protein [Rhodospirillales bacterium]MBT4700861.1 adenylate/guanylate cyclase domain-containing protein [Rhodospirillaceae bacterium]MBT5034533.1 adenylate/guanylate cyclase domain-containing protein [Rhodospirillaceae bacterium]MBT6221236.1 adenylate/guanylate cyclase domain-containing protein [Rhodospirillaceae bacterium]